jgi:hypothetical protein
MFTEMANAALFNYVKDNVRRGVPIEAIRKALRQTGYGDREIESAVNLVLRKKSIEPGVGQKKLGVLYSFLAIPRNLLQKIRQGRKPRMQGAMPPFSYTSQQPWRYQGESKPGGWFGMRVRQKSQQGRYAHLWKYVPHACLLVMLVVIIVLLFMSRAKPPILVFIDNRTGEHVGGSVYFNGNYLGDTTGTFNRLPKDFCSQPGDLLIVTEQGPILYKTDKSDCKSRRVILLVDVIPVKEVEFYVTMEFMTEEGNELLNGTLVIDGDNKGAIYGTYELYQGECRIIRVLNLTEIKHPGIPLGYVEWSHDPLNCEHDVIRYKVHTYYLPPPEQPVNKTDVIPKILTAFESATRKCQQFCPNATVCSAEQKILFCSQYVENVDLNGNGIQGEFVNNVFGSLGVCESRVYCPQIIFCRCGEILTFDDCVSVLCQRYLSLNMSLSASAKALQTQFQEGGCNTDSSYKAQSSWWNYYLSEGKLDCKP